MPQDLLPAVANTDIHAGIRRRAQVAREERGRAHDGGEKLGHDPRLQSGIGEECPRRNAGAEAHHQNGPRLATVNQQRQERLEAHVAPGRRRVAGVRNALDVEPTEAPVARILFEDGHGPAGVFRVEDQRPAPLLGQQGAQLVARHERQAEDGEHHHRRADARADAPVAAFQRCDRAE